MTFFSYSFEQFLKLLGSASYTRYDQEPVLERFFPNAKFQFAPKTPLRVKRSWNFRPLMLPLSVWEWEVVVCTRDGNEQLFDGWFLIFS